MPFLYVPYISILPCDLQKNKWIIIYLIKYSMNWRDVLSILLGLKKPELVPIPKNNNGR